MNLVSRKTFHALALLVVAARATEDIQVLVYETEIQRGVTPASSLVDQIERLPGVAGTIFGQGEHFDGYGSKYVAVMPILKELSPDTLVVLSDGRDVLLNSPSFSGLDTMKSAVEEFHAAFARLTADRPNAVVISAEAQCCVSALTYAEPGDYFAEDGRRQQRACSSGASDCLWNGDDKAEPWEHFMQTLARERSYGKAFEDIYLNAGLMAGRAENLVHVIEALALENQEDDQAVLTDFMYRNQDDIVLDYGQTLFGSNRAEEEDNCMFQTSSAEVAEEPRLVHKKTATSPLFVHSPGGLLLCHEELAEELGVQQVSGTARRRLLEWKTGKNNYGTKKDWEGKKDDGKDYWGKKDDGKDYWGKKDDGKDYWGKKDDGEKDDGKDYWGKKDDGKDYWGKKDDGKDYWGGKEDDGKDYWGKKDDGKGYW